MQQIGRDVDMVNFWGVTSVLCVLSIFLVPSIAVATNHSSVSPAIAEVYNGVVYDQEKNPLPGVVVVVSSSGGSNSAVTNSNGQWGTSILYFGGTVTEDFYWNSSKDGPLLLALNNPNLYTNETVKVWKVPATYPLLFEFPNTPSSNATCNIGYTISSTVQVTVAAKVSGKISDGFLTGGASGSVSVTCQLTTGFSTNHTYPYVISYTLGTAYAVESPNGSSIAYVAPFNNPGVLDYGTSKTTEYMTESEAFQAANSTGLSGNGNYWGTPSVAPKGQNTYSVYESIKATVDTQVSISVSIPGFASGSVTFETAYSVSTSQSISITLYNPTANTEYFVVWLGGITYGGGLDAHVWYYGIAAPP